MALAYLELERVNPAWDTVAVDADSILVFDTIVASEGLGIQFQYDINTGIITFLEAGYYYVDWYVAPQSGFTTDGSNWAVQTAISGVSFVCSSHSKVAATTGFALVNAEAGETARLVNVSDGVLILSQAVKSKAGLVVYELATMFYAP